MEGLKKLYSGDFNDMEVENLSDGSVIITLTSRKWEGVERFRVKDLYGLNEEVLDVDTGAPITKRDPQNSVPQVSKEARRGYR